MYTVEVGHSYVGEIGWHLLHQTLDAGALALCAIGLVKFTPSMKEVRRKWNENVGRGREKKKKRKIITERGWEGTTTIFATFSCQNYSIIFAYDNVVA